MPTAVVLLSGGLDSYTAAAVARRDGFDVHALSIRYGQRHHQEMAPRHGVAAALGVSRHLVLDLDLSAIGGLGAHLRGDRRAQGPPMDAADIPSPTCPPATPSSCRLRSAGPRCWAPPTSTSASTRSTTRVIPTAVPSSSARSSNWRAGDARGCRGAAAPIHTPLMMLTKAEIIGLGRRWDSTTGSPSAATTRTPTASVRALRQLPAARCRLCRRRCSRPRRRTAGGLNMARPLRLQILVVAAILAVVVLGAHLLRLAAHLPRAAGAAGGRDPGDDRGGGRLSSTATSRRPTRWR
jgi:7-cyano-7-deazaguanine synthase